jgi:hypothetical protein
VPLLANTPGNQGPFSPYLFRVQGYWILAATFANANDVQIFASETLTPGTFRRVGKWFDPPSGWGWCEGVNTFWDKGTMHLYFGATNNSTAKGSIWHGTIEWNTL